MLGTPLTRGMGSLGFSLVLNSTNHGELLGRGEVVGLMLGKRNRRIPVVNDSTSVPLWALPLSSPLHSFQGDSL